MKNALKILCYLLIAIPFSSLTNAQEKITITKAEELPRHSYDISTTALELFNNQQDLSELMDQIKQDILSDLEKYDIQDKTYLKEYYSILFNIYFLSNDIDKALEMLDKKKDLEDKPAAKYMSGLVTYSIIDTKKVDTKEPVPAFEASFKKAVNSLPWDVVEDEIKRLKGTSEILSENLLIGQIQSSIEPAVEKNSSLSFDLAATIVRYRFLTDEILTLSASINKITSEYIKANSVQKPDIWNSRSVALKDGKNLNKVVVGIWDSGVDEEIFNDNLFVNKDEVIDGKDTDNDGYIDNIHGIAYDLESEKTLGLLFPLSEEQQKKMPGSVELMKGLMDMQAAIDSKEATKLKGMLSQMNPEDVEPFFEEIGLFGNYAHGTHVAGIAAAGNPYIKLLPIRISFEYKMIPPEPTIKKSIQEGKMFAEVVDYCKANNVKVVNMSWGGNMRSVEYALEANGAGGNAEERKKLAAEIFKISRDSLYNAIKNAPGILFITSGGNSDNDAAFEETIPSSFDLPNIISVGAVDQAGDETGFTSFGETVKIFANGFEVESYIPGGQTMKMSGTSMSSPNVANLAAKMLAYKPDLTPTQIIDLLIKNADKNESGRVLLINPRNTIETVKKL